MKKNELDEIQEEYSKRTSEITEKGWQGYRGMVFQEILCAHLEKYMPSGLEFVKRAWVEDHPQEIDLLLVKKGAEPIDLTPAYRSDDVIRVFEIKASGMFCKKENVEEVLREFNSRITEGTGKEFTYITRRESRRNSISTKNALGNDAYIFFIGNGENRITNYDDWTRLIISIKKTKAL